jgi:hypothetical protein
LLCPILADLRQFVQRYFPGKTIPPTALTSTWQFCIPNPSLISVQSGVSVEDQVTGLIKKMWGCGSTSQQRAASGSDCYGVNLVDTYRCFDNEYQNYYRDYYYYYCSESSSSHSEDSPGKCRSLADVDAYCGSKIQLITRNLTVSEACDLNYWNRETYYCNGNYASCVDLYSADVIGFPSTSITDGWKASNVGAGFSALQSYCRMTCNTTSRGYPTQEPSQVCGSNLLTKPPFQWPFFKGFECFGSRLDQSYNLLKCSTAPAWDGALSGGRHIFDADRVQGSYFGGRATIPPVDTAAKLVPVLQWDCDFTLALRLNSRLGLALGLKELRNVYDFASDKVTLVSHLSAESMVTAGDPSPRQIMQMQQCRAAARSPSFSISLKDFAERFAVWSPAFWLRALMESTDTTPASFAGFKTMASAMFSKPVGPLGMLIQGMDTCVPGQYLTLGCFMRYCFRPFHVSSVLPSQNKS